MSVCLDNCWIGLTRISFGELPQVDVCQPEFEARRMNFSSWAQVCVEAVVLVVVCVTATSYAPEPIYGRFLLSIVQSLQVKSETASLDAVCSELNNCSVNLICALLAETVCGRAHGRQEAKITIHPVFVR